MNGSISYSFEEETPIAKVKWFQSLSIEERIDLFCSIVEIALLNNPKLAEYRDVEQIKRSVQILEKK